MFRRIKEVVTQAIADSEAYNRRMLYLYKTEQYIKIEKKSDIKEFYYAQPEDTMIVLNDKHIYVATRKRYKWKRYKYNAKKDILVSINCENSGSNHDTDYYWYFPPNKKAIKAIKNKDESLRTDDENSALNYYTRKCCCLIAMIIAVVYGIIFELVMNYL